MTKEHREQDSTQPKLIRSLNTAIIESTVEQIVANADSDDERFERATDELIDLKTSLTTLVRPESRGFAGRLYPGCSKKGSDN